MVISGYEQVYSNIITYNNTLTLGRNWYPPETANREAFRWASNHAELIVGSPSGAYSTLQIDIEGGPSLNRRDFLLNVLDDDGEQVAVMGVMGRQQLAFDVPVTPGVTSVLRLYVESDDLVLKADTRILNFRVFQLGWRHLN